MTQKINKKARFNRHLRIIRDNLLSDRIVVKKWEKTTYSYLLVAFFIVIVLPIYPRFSSVVHSNTQYDFYRWDIDEYSIIWSYYWENLEQDDYDTPLLESFDSFLSVNTILNDERDLLWTNEIIDYEVKNWESFYSIAYKFKVSSNSIYWANNFSKNHTLHPWNIIKIPPVSWIIHQVKKWETLLTISKEYNVDNEKIINQNLLSENEKLNIWEVLVIPWAIKKVVIPKYKKIIKKYISKSSNNKSYGFSKYASSEYVNAWWKYKLVWRKPQHTFYWWNCTRYVAQYKNVNWWWNANMWLINAKRKWYRNRWK